VRDLPFVPFFTADWLASSARVDMTLPERAIYLDLLFQIWERGGAIPADETKLAKMAMVTPAEFSAAWPAVKKYIVTHPDEPEMLTNLKMLDVIRKQANVHQARSNAGRRGAASRWANSKPHGKTDGGAVAKVWHPETESETESETETEAETENLTCASDDARLSGSSLLQPKRKNVPFSEDKKPTAEQTAWFEEFWQQYWLRKAKKPAFAAFCKHVKTTERFAEVIAAVAAQKPEMESRQPQHRPLAASWLNAERWTDEPPEPAKPAPLPKCHDW
jgi:uncharacterized protein YdaU (DUF1376 family)